MKTYAYSKGYLDGAMTTLATLLDYAVNYNHEFIDNFFQKFINMGFALQFEKGNPDVIAGHSGIELYSMITGKCSNLPIYYELNRSMEYWLGWSLAYYQWYSNRTFREITAVVKPSEMLNWYPILHEADLMRFVEVLDQHLNTRITNLEIFRNNAGLSQEQLSMLSGVPISTIRSYEKRNSDLSKAQFNILNALATVLHCSIYELMDSNTYPLYMNQPNTQIPFTVQMQQEINNSMFTHYQNSYPRVAQANSLRLGYLNQFPYQCVKEQADKTIINTQTLCNNWNLYWGNIIQQQTYSDVEKQRKKQLIQSIVKEIVGQEIKSSGNQQAALVYDTMCTITAPNIIEAVSKAISVMLA